jgi:hypothetical protein
MSPNHSGSAWSRLVAAAIFAAVTTLPASTLAQRAVPRSGSAEPSTGGRTQGGDHGGGRTASEGGKAGSGGQTTSGGGQASGGDRASSGGSEKAVRRAPASGDTGTRGDGRNRTAVRRDRGGATESGSSTADAKGNDTVAVVPPYSRPRGSNPPTGYAVQRKGPPPIFDGDDSAIWVPGGYYGGYYPWGYGSFGLGGYYGGYYDPWYYGSSPYYSGYDYDYDGRLRLKVKPRSAEVFVDGYYSGLVDEFDGVFQRLRLEPGPHRIEIRANGYETLAFDVRITPDHTVTYSGELQRIN